MSANPWLKSRHQAPGKAPTGVEAPHPGCPSGPAKPAPLRPSAAVTTASIANRQAMPQVAAVVDQLRSVFGPVQVVFASEGGKELGREPPPGVKPMITGACAPKRAARKGVRS